jgi:hypothetical protein
MAARPPPLGPVEAAAARLVGMPKTLERVQGSPADPLGRVSGVGLSAASPRAAAEVKVRAEREAGRLLAETEKATGTKGQLRGRDPSGGRPTRPPEDSPPTLADLDITKDQSSRWQIMAKLPAAKFEEHIAA